MSNAESATDGSPPTRSARQGRRTEKISEVVAREIVQDIAARQLEADSMLPPEAVMLEHYGVGRASLREALRILETFGLIVIRPGPGGGPMVNGVDSRDFGRMATFYLHLSGATLGEIVESRLVMEPMMARLAAERQSKVHIAELRALLERSNQAEEEGVGGTEHFTEFHGLVAGMSGNRVLDLMGRSLKDIYYGRVESLIFPPKERERVVGEHARIAEAIVDGRSQDAEQLMRAHMEEYAKFARKRYPSVFKEVVDWG